jgi:release factor glutamine methyltransferase
VTEPPLTEALVTEPPRTVAQAIERGAAALARAGVDQPRREARLLLGHALGLSAGVVFGQPERPLSGPEGRRLEGLLRRRGAREPMAYLLREREFWSLSFEVTPATLIPRPESETLVEAALAFARDRDSSLRVLDLGTGSGCLLLALLSELAGATGLGVDSSAAALAVARRNAARLGLAARAGFVAGHWGEALAGGFDIVLCNPPYVADGEMARLAPEITRFEPAAALFAGADGGRCYQALAPDLARLLAAGGAAFVELAAGARQRVATIFEAQGLVGAAWHRDLGGIERCAVFVPCPVSNRAAARVSRTIPNVVRRREKKSCKLCNPG